MAVQSLAPPISLIERVKENIIDPVTFEFMIEAVTLFPCGHALNKDTTIRCIAQNKLCPLDRRPIVQHAPNFTVRDLAIIVRDHPPEGLSAEAQHHFEKAKALAEQNNFEAAVPMLLEALQLSPGYEKAQAYLDFCLQRTSEPHLDLMPSPAPHPSSEKKVSSKHDPEAFALSNSKEDYVNLLLSLLEKSRIKKHPTLPEIFQQQIKELMSQEVFTQKQQESYRWTKKLYIDHKVNSFVAQELEALHRGTSEPNVSPKQLNQEMKRHFPVVHPIEKQAPHKLSLLLLYRLLLLPPFQHGFAELQSGTNILAMSESSLHCLLRLFNDLVS